MQRCACSVLLIMIAVGCVIGAGIGLYIHLSDRHEPTLIITGARPGHPYGNDALFAPDFHRPMPSGGRTGNGPDFHHGSRDRNPDAMRPRPPFHAGHPPYNKLPFEHDAMEPPHPDHGGPPYPDRGSNPHPNSGGVFHHGPHERPSPPRGPYGRRHGVGSPHREHAGVGPEYDLHHDHGTVNANGRKPRPDRPYHGHLNP